MRAAAADFRTARQLGVRAHRVIGVAVLLSALLAAIVAVVSAFARPRHAQFALTQTIVVLVGVVVGGSTGSGRRRWAASR